MRRLLLAVVLLVGCDMQDDCAKGRKLMMSRGMGETFRACFSMNGDCDLIAGAMSEKEPTARWFCK